MKLNVITFSLAILSTATTDSNNSNETSGSPSSITSGGSPVQSPVQHHPGQTSGSAALQLHSLSANNVSGNLNYSSDSTTMAEAAAAAAAAIVGDKRVISKQQQQDNNIAVSNKVKVSNA